eukprot:4569197-Karenia_brevis.AAC.1
MPQQRPRKPWISTGGWHAIRYVAECRRTSRWWHDMQRTAYAAFCFSVWKYSLAWSVLPRIADKRRYASWDAYTRAAAIVHRCFELLRHCEVTAAYLWAMVARYCKLKQK